MTLLLALGTFLSLAAAFLLNLFPIWNSAVVGGLQDTRLFLWNGWWFHHAITSGLNPYQTDLLFHPFGARLIAHDFPLWMNLVTFAGQKMGMNLIGASNLWFIISWVLAGLCVFGLVREVLGSHERSSVAPALVAGVFAMTHSYGLARAMQNWGQFNFYGIAVFLLCFLRARRLGTWRSYGLGGIALAWTAACHYYFFIYSLVVWSAVVAYDLIPYRVTCERRQTRLRAALLVLAVVAGLASLAIALRPGELTFGSVHISLRTPTNTLFAMWMLLLVWVGTAWHYGVEKRSIATPTRPYLARQFVLGATAFILLLPLFWETFQLVAEGGYPKQSILWKTHLAGANLLALFFPNPIHALWGERVSAWFVVRGMNPQEQAAMLGWVAMAVLFASRIWKEGRRERLWLWLAGSATVLAMGAHLHVAQWNTWCPLPFFVVRLLPLLGNVRVPERWMALGVVAWSVVLALAIVRLCSARGWSLPKTCWLIAGLILFENWPGLPGRQPPPVLPLYQQLKALPPGGVLVLPFYAGDSSIGTGNAVGNRYIFPWDHLWAQTFHQKPIIGGYIGRISRRIIEKYQADPFMNSIIALEEEQIMSKEPEPAFGQYAITHLGFRYVLVYTSAVQPQVLHYVRQSLPLVPVGQSEDVQLYRIQQ